MEFVEQSSRFTKIINVCELADQIGRTKQTRKIIRRSVLFFSGDRKSRVFDICFDLRSVQVNESDFTEALPYKYFRARHMVWRHRCICCAIWNAYRFACCVDDVFSITIATTNAADVPDVMAQ